MSAELTQERPERRPHEYYSPERKAEVLALLDANEGNIWRTAQEANIAHTTIQYWESNRERFDDLRKQKKEDLDSILDKTVHKYINSIFSHDLEETPLNQKAQAFGIVFDKLQISRSLPTSITQHQNSESLTIVLQQVLNEITSTDTDS
jgi:hypothetical protein